MELFFSGHVCENEDDLALRAKVVRLHTDVVVHTIKLLLLALLLHFLGLFAFRALFFVLIARRCQTLVHVQKHSVICGKLDHFCKEGIFVNVGDVVVDGAQKVDQLV